MDPVKDLMFTEDSKVSGTSASNHKHYSWQGCDGWGLGVKSPWSSTRSLWCVCNKFAAQRKRRRDLFQGFPPTPTPITKKIIIQKYSLDIPKIITIWLSVPCLASLCMCVLCVCACVCEKERESECISKKNQKKKNLTMITWNRFER